MSILLRGGLYFIRWTSWSRAGEIIKGQMIQGTECHPKESRFYLINDRLALKTFKWENISILEDLVLINWGAGTEK